MHTPVPAERGICQELGARPTRPSPTPSPAATSVG